MCSISTSFQERASTKLPLHGLSVGLGARTSHLHLLVPCTDVLLVSPHNEPHPHSWLSIAMCVLIHSELWWVVDDAAVCCHHPATPLHPSHHCFWEVHFRPHYYTRILDDVIHSFVFVVAHCSSDSRHDPQISERVICVEVIDSGESRRHLKCGARVVRNTRAPPQGYPREIQSWRFHPNMPMPKFALQLPKGERVRQAGHSR